MEAAGQRELAVEHDVGIRGDVGERCIGGDGAFDGAAMLGEALRSELQRDAAQAVGDALDRGAVLREQRGVELLPLPRQVAFQRVEHLGDTVATEKLQQLIPGGGIERFLRGWSHAQVVLERLSNATSASLAFSLRFTGGSLSDERVATMRDRRNGRAAAAAAALAVMACGQAPATDFQLTRWAEDYAALSDTAHREAPLDSIKHIPLGERTGRYLSLGGHVRMKAAAADAPLFGLGMADADGQLFRRVHLHADLHHSAHLRAFVELVDARAFGKDRIFPVDRNLTDLQQAFVDLTGSAGGGELVLRGGRQELKFDAAQRFVALREGPNVRRVFDGFHLGWSRLPVRVEAFHLRLVEPRDTRSFDDRSVDGARFSGMRAGYGDAAAKVDGYVYRYELADAMFAGIEAAERRWVFGMQATGRDGALDWDLEALLQTGDFGQAQVRAWAAAGVLGYTFAQAPWRPRLGLQFDAASGDRHADDDRLETFNPLFPKGSYFTQAGLTDFANLRHAQLSARLHPDRASAIGLGAGHLARESRADAAYAQPLLPIPRSLTGGRAIADYLRLDARQRFGRHLMLSAEVVRYWPAENLRRVGAQRADYAELVLRFVF